MRFLDQEIRLKITPKGSESLSFKAYLEKSDITYEIQERSLEFVPLNFTNYSIITRTIQNIDLSFDVIAEDRREAIKNYDDLHSLIQALKPQYIASQGQYIPSRNNTFGLLTVNFKGLPKIKKNGNEELEIHVKQFNYTINKEMGYIQLPYLSSKEDSKLYSLYEQGQMKLVPIGFKINLQGRILLDLEDTIKVSGASGITGGNPGGKTNGVDVFTDADAERLFGTNEQFKNKILSAFEKATGASLYSLKSSQRIKDAISKTAEALNNSILDENGGNPAWKWFPPGPIGGTTGKSLEKSTIENFNAAEDATKHKAKIDELKELLK